MVGDEVVVSSTDVGGDSFIPTTKDELTTQISNDGIGGALGSNKEVWE